MTGTDPWATGAPYERYVGRWSRQIAPRFLAWLGAPAGLAWLDVACGTGALTQAIADGCQPRRLAAIDQSAGFLALARQQLGDAPVDLRQADAQALPLDDAAFDRVVSGLALNFFPDPRRGLAEMARVARPGGEVALYVWDYAHMEPMRHFWQAAARLDPAVRDEADRFPICRRDALRRLFQADPGLAGVTTHAIEIVTAFRDFDDYWTPFLGGQGIAPAYCMSLPDDRRVALRDRLRRTLPREPDGSIRLTARAWAVRARRA